MITSLRGRKEKLERDIMIVGDKSKMLEEVWEQKCKEEGKEIDPDVLILPIDPQSQQMLELSAEVAALEDTMYYLDRALANDSNDSVDLQTHLKEIRKLARRQFLAKAHLKKIGERRQGNTFELR